MRKVHQLNDIQNAKKKLRLQRAKNTVIMSEEIISEILSYLDSYDAICSYYSIPGEADTHKLNKRIAQKNKLYLPKIIKDNLTFYKVNINMDNLSPSKINPLIKEPSTQTALHGNNIALLAPGVFFSLTGSRLGRGGGYYDKFLSTFSGEKIGLLYKKQLLNEIPKEEHDISMDLLYIHDPSRNHLSTFVPHH